jgi:hypothetical protein
MGAMLDTRETLRTFPNLGQLLFAAREQTRTNQKKPEWHNDGPERGSTTGVISWKIGGIALPDALTDNHHSTLHAFFLTAKEGGYTEFELQLVASPKGRVEFCISPRQRSEMSAKFEVRGNMIRAAANEASVVPTDDTDFGRA